MIDYDKISIWDNGPVQNVVSPDEEPKRDPNNSYDAVNAQVRSFPARDAQVRHTHRKYSQQSELYFDDPSMNHKSEAWQMNPDTEENTKTLGSKFLSAKGKQDLIKLASVSDELRPVLSSRPVESEIKEGDGILPNIQCRNKDSYYVQWPDVVGENPEAVVKDVPSSIHGPLDGPVKDWIEQRIKWHTGSDNILHLRSWWSILNEKVAVPKHSHTYQTKKRTVSGIIWTKGDICPLFVQRPKDILPDQINNVPGRLVIFSNNTNHWTEPYPHKTTRAGISFDYLIQDQDVCECGDEAICHRCMHLTHNLRKLGIKNIYSGGSTTIKYETETEIVAGNGPGETTNPVITRLVKREFSSPLKEGGNFFRSPPKDYK